MSMTASAAPPGSLLIGGLPSVLRSSCSAHAPSTAAHRQGVHGDRVLTTSQLAAELEDVPPGSLYRHVARLTRAGVLSVVAERRVRGAVERTYTLRPAAAQIQPGEARAMSRDEHTGAFLAYVATDPPDPAAEAGYRTGILYLTDDELAGLLADLRRVSQPRLANPPGNGRRRRLIYPVCLPAPEPPPGGER
jgi:DNA-binding transcriptional ArsR family regulator